MIDAAILAPVAGAMPVQNDQQRNPTPPAVAHCYETGASAVTLRRYTPGGCFRPREKDLIMRRAIATLLLLAAAIPLSGCIVVDHPHGGPGYCYYHPYACR
jgi:hypothetical protein